MPPPISAMTPGAVHPIVSSAVGQDPVGDPDEQRDQADRERHVAQPVDLRRDRGRRAPRACNRPRSFRAGRREPRRGRPAATRSGPSTPPRTRPMNDPAMAATLLIPSARPAGWPGTRRSVSPHEFAMSIAAPRPCTTRMPIRHSAAALPCSQSTDSRTEPIVKTAKPSLYMRTRPNMSPIRPRRRRARPSRRGTPSASTADSPHSRERGG